MSLSRRDFVRLTSGATAALGLAASEARAASLARLGATSLVDPDAPLDDPGYKALAMKALDAAKSAGAQYADVRVNRNRTQAITTRA